MLSRFQESQVPFSSTLLILVVLLRFLSVIGCLHSRVQVPVLVDVVLIGILVEIEALVPVLVPRLDGASGSLLCVFFAFAARGTGPHWPLTHRGLWRAGPARARTYPRRRKQRKGWGGLFESTRPKPRSSLLTPSPAFLGPFQRRPEAGNGARRPFQPIYRRALFTGDPRRRRWRSPISPPTPGPPHPPARRTSAADPAPGRRPF